MNGGTSSRAQSSDLPRVLVMSHAPFERVTATGITLTNIFRDWPAGKIAQLYVSAEAPDTSVCQSFHRVSPESAPLDFAVRRFLTRGGRSIVRGRSDGAAVPTELSRLPWQERLHSQMRALADVSPVRLDKESRRWLDKVRPEVVYSPLGNVRVARLAVEAARYLGCPLVPHFLDDWPSTLYASGELGGQARRRVNKALQEVVASSPIGIAICAEMATEFEDRYGLPFVDLMNCVEIAAGADVADAPSVSRPGDRIELVYSGGMHLGRDEVLKEVAEVLPGLQSDGVSVTLTIIGVPGARFVLSDAAREHVVVVGHVGSEEVLRRIAGADVLVHVESTDPQYSAFTRLSISTKIPQYLATGRAILAIGPDEAASMRHLGASGAAVLIDSVDRSRISSAIRELAENAALRDTLGGFGRTYAYDHHRQEVVSERLRATLGDAVSSSPRRASSRSSGAA